MCGITKKGQESPVKGYNCRFLPLIFPNLWHLKRYTPLNGMCFWSFIERIRHFIFQKRYCVRIPHAISGWKSPAIVEFEQVSAGWERATLPMFSKKYSGIFRSIISQNISGWVLLHSPATYATAQSWSQTPITWSKLTIETLE